MYTATTAFISPVARNRPGMVSPALSRPIAIPAEATMNSAFKMLLAAMMRERCVASERSWISAYSGTI
jgi:hypothetical protein